MRELVDWFRPIPQPPLWIYVLLPVVATISFSVAFPFGLDILPDIALEGLYLGLALALAIPIRRFGIGVLELGWLFFLFGRYIDFLDELFIEPQPFVEPYLSGFIMVVSFAIMIVGSFTLLEERQERIDRLEAQNEELELKNSAIDEAPIGITIADMTADDNPLTTVNAGFTRLTGYDAEESVGHNCRFLQGEDTASQPVSRMREVIENGESVEVTLLNYRKDGTPFWNNILLAPLKQNGEVHNYVGFQQDVSDRIEYEQQLEEQRNNLQLLSQMVRHDIRNDLQLIEGHAEILAEHVTDDGEESLKTIEERTKNAIDITTSARELSDIMLGDEREHKYISLTNTVDQQIEEVQSSFEHATIERDGPFPDITVSADAMLESVFRNLLKNAVQHNHTGDPRITVSMSESDGSATVRIADNGPGIPDDQKEQIFDHGEKGLDSEGTGIGTYLVKTLVTQYGGDVWIEDNDPTGAVFVVTLPTVK